MPRPIFRLPGRALRPSALALNLAMAGALLAAMGATPAAQAQTVNTPTRRYDIPAGPLNMTLNRYAQEAGVPLSAPGALTQGKTGPGLSGEATVEQGFARLLQGQGLQAVRQADGTYTLQRAATPDATTTLPTVRVTAAPDPMKADLPKPYAGGQVARGGRVGILGNQDVMATPFSTTSYTSRMIEDWQADTVAQVLLADPSVREISPEAGPTENFNMRGFYLRSEDFAWNGLFGLVSYNRVPTEFLERVEVLKGPGALLYGMAPQGSVGATINLVPKRAGAAPLTRLTASFASHSNLGAHLDLGRRFGVDDAFGIRVNAVKSSGRTALDGQSERKDMGAMALDYHGERLRATLDAYLNDDRQRGNIPLATSFATAQIPSPPRPRGQRHAGHLFPFTQQRADRRRGVRLQSPMDRFCDGRRQSPEGRGLPEQWHWQKCAAFRRLHRVGHERAELLQHPFKPGRRSRPTAHRPHPAHHHTRRQCD